MHKNTIKSIERSLDDYFNKNEIAKEYIWNSEEELKYKINWIKKIAILKKISEEEALKIFNNYYYSNIKR